jgi:hypothetical protein
MLDFIEGYREEIRIEMGKKVLKSFRLVLIRIFLGYSFGQKT